MSKSIVKNNSDKIKILNPSKDQGSQTEAYEAITIFVKDMIGKNGKFDIGSSLLLTKLVKEVIEMANSYKELKGIQKKDLVLTIVKDIFDKELQNANISGDVKNLINMVVGNSIEPSIDLAIYVANGGIKIDKKQTTLRSCCLYSRKYKKF